MSINRLQEGVPLPRVLQQSFNQFHGLQHLLFLETLPYDLHTYREAMHLRRIVHLIHVVLDDIPRGELSESISVLVNMRHREHTGRVIELQGEVS